MVERGHNDMVAPDEWVAYEYAKVRWFYDMRMRLPDRTAILEAHDLELVGFGRRSIHAFTTPQAARQVLLMHYPQMANGLGRRFDLILAGHSHGGQIRLPLVGAIILPKGVRPYEHGFYETPGGPLYVNAGIGTYRIPFRWNCRPELTLVTCYPFYWVGPAPRRFVVRARPYRPAIRARPTAVSRNAAATPKGGREG